MTNLDNISSLGLCIYFLDNLCSDLDYEILLHKLECYGIRETLYNWFSNYLQNKVHYVEANAINSGRLILSRGVPQGSVLGPLLYILYVKDFAFSEFVFRHY